MKKYQCFLRLLLVIGFLFSTINVFAEQRYALCNLDKMNGHDSDSDEDDHDEIYYVIEYPAKAILNTTKVDEYAFDARSPLGDGFIYKDVFSAKAKGTLSIGLIKKINKILPQGEMTGMDDTKIIDVGQITFKQDDIDSSFVHDMPGVQIFPKINGKMSTCWINYRSFEDLKASHEGSRINFDEENKCCSTLAKCCSAIGQSIKKCLTSCKR